MQNPEGWGPNNYTDQTNRYNDVSPSSSLSQVPHHDGTPATPLYEYTTQPTKNIGPGTGLLYYNKHVDGPGPDESNEPHVIVTQSLPPSDSIRSALHFYALLLTLVLPLVALIVWGVYMKNEHHVFATLAGTVIGGHLEQTQAKAIDFVASAILVPLVMTVFNYTWFACARVCVVNEASTIDLNDSRGVSLHTLSTASTQSGGSYSPLVLWSLVKGRTWRLCTLGLVVLASAIGASALSNIIAYESFSEDIASSDPRTLRSLSDAIIEISPFGEQEYGFSNDEQILAAQNVSSMFNGISFVAAALDSEGGYIGTNATEASMNDLDASISSLNDVPGYRLTADCTPTVLEPDIGFTILTSGSGLVEIIVQANFSEDIRTAFNLSDGWRQYSSTYQYLGSVADIFFDIVLYNQILTFYKGVMTPDITTLVYFETAYTNNSIQTDFGLVEATYENVSTYTSTTESLTRYDMEAYAVQCLLYRQEGSLNFTISRGPSPTPPLRTHEYRIRHTSRTGRPASPLPDPHHPSRTSSSTARALGIMNQASIILRTSPWPPIISSMPRVKSNASSTTWPPRTAHATYPSTFTT